MAQVSIVELKIANTKLVLYLDIDTVLSSNFFEKLE